jgi:hypothetical protein
MNRMLKYLRNVGGEDLPAPARRLRCVRRSACLAVGAVAFAAGCGAPSAQAPAGGTAPAIQQQTGTVGASGPVAGAVSSPGIQPNASVGGVQPATGSAGSGSRVLGATAGAPAIAGAAASAAAVGGGAGDLPCGIAQALASNCQKCHASEPVFGAPMPLVTLADLQKPSKTNAAMTVAQAAAKRLNDAASPMPPAANITATDRKLLTDYLVDGKAPPEPADGKCVIAQSRSDEYLHMGVTAEPGETLL